MDVDTPIISVRNLHKWHSGVHALKGISRDFQRNETVGLVGDNGAGKSTLIGILSGLYKPDRGEVLVEGKNVMMHGPADAMRLGIETIYQNNSMVPCMSIMRNLFIGREPIKFSLGGIGLLDEGKMKAECMAALENVHLHLRSPTALVSDLSGGQRQGVAIARAMHFKSKVMILDEPTNHLSVRETDKVIGFVRSLKAQSVTSIFISHNMHHVMACCERIIAMSLGEIVLDKKVHETSIDEVHAIL